MQFKPGRAARPAGSSSRAGGAHRALGLFRRVQITEIDAWRLRRARRAGHRRGGAVDDASATVAVSRPFTTLRATGAGRTGRGAARIRAARLLRRRPAEPVGAQPLGEPLHASQSPPRSERRQSRVDGTGIGFPSTASSGPIASRARSGTSDLIVTGVIEQGVRTSFNFARKGVNVDVVRRSDAGAACQRPLLAQLDTNLR